MAVRTAYVVDAHVFVAQGSPNGRDSLALARQGIVLHLGDETWTAKWGELSRVRITPRGAWSSRSGWLVRPALRVARWVYSIVAGLLFVVSFGGLGGAPWGGRGAIEVTLQEKGQPSAFAATYAIPISWPRDCTELERTWFTITIEAVVGTGTELDVVALTQILDSVDSASELRTRIPELVKR